MAEKKEKITTHLEVDEIVRGFRAEIEKLQCELADCPRKYERAMAECASAEELEELEKAEIALEKRLHNLTVAHLNTVRQMSDAFQPEAKRRDREAFDKVIEAETVFREGEIRRAQESAAEQKAWQEAQAALQRERGEIRAIHATMNNFIAELFDKTRKRAQERREKRAAELAAIVS